MGIGARGKQKPHGDARMCRRRELLESAAVASMFEFAVWRRRQVLDRQVGR